MKELTLVQEVKRTRYMTGLTGKHSINRRDNCYLAFQNRITKRRNAKK